MKKIISFITHRPFFLIIFVWFLFASPYFIKGLMPFPSKYLVTFFSPWNNYYGMPVKNNAMPDVITQIYPWKKITIESWKQGQVPRWNPYQFSGNAHLANFQSAVFSPFNLLFFVLPFNDAWSVLILLQPLLAGLFMYLFLRTLKRSEMGSLIGGVAFMFCGFVVGWMAYGTLAYAILYLPLMLYGIEKYFAKPTFMSGLLICITLPLSLFSGHFQTSIYFLLVSASYIVYKWTISKKYKIFLFALLLFVFGIIISLPQLLPTYHFYQQSVRSQLYQKGEVIPWQYMVTMFAPDFFGNPVTRNDWFGAYAEWGSFAGVVPLMLALFAQSLKKRSASVNFFSIWMFVPVLFVFTTPFANLLAYAKIPVLSTSAFNRIIVLFSFSVAALSSFGFDRLLEVWKEQRNKKQAIRYLGLWSLIVGTIWLLIFSKNLLFIEKADAEKLAIARSNMMMPTMLFMFAAVVWLSGFGKKKTTVNFLALVLVFVTVADLLRFANKWMPFDPKEYMYPTNKALEFIQQRAGYSRVFGNFGNEAQSVFGLYGIEGYDPLYVSRYGEFMSAVRDGIIGTSARSVVGFEKNGAHSKAVVDLLGVKYILHSKGDLHNIWAFPFWQYFDSFGLPVFSDEKYEVYENNRVYPRAFLVHSYQIITNSTEIIGYMFDEDTDLSKTIVVEKEPSIAIQACVTEGKPEKVEIASYTPNKIQINVESNCASLLFLSDPYYQGWQVSVGGKPAELLRADYAFRAVVVPEGTSEVVFSYENWNF